MKLLFFLCFPDLVIKKLISSELTLGPSDQHPTSGEGPTRYTCLAGGKSGEGRYLFKSLPRENIIILASMSTVVVGTE